ncbi:MULTISPECIES: FAD-binding oxidoreductase [Streptomyces]|uniref:D-lactate dehydrogenase (cytochrome) n=1 Tax=Streptomyces albus (strain ATCC 21838 / DSM 41398 / FERM P-419 / JCM 4703 / NBRC 107858) TaxID=1081613 RepID=A0A0B5EGM1_STRA4|nr:FAD-binding oxidoreductase [Streptomyces sp. SCSIO ZS0520]AJE80484.1 FAD linked oxidase [Streptomyces albus]AOU74799.1 FAD linked oxidase [Streptomyces albus]AYN30609.1 FAD-binding oxidoreductase [Streptomyces albus]
MPELSAAAGGLDALVPPGSAAQGEALEAARRLLGPQRVRLAADAQDPGLLLGPNASLFRSRRVAAVLRPATAEQVPALVELFSRSTESGSLHVISTGRNWGLGSREPAQDDVVVLDLGDLDQVRELDVDAGWAVVEPGVTQGHLSRLLAHTPRMANVTVSAAATSIVGNALDRGVALRGQRTEDLVGLEVVLPGGECVRVGWWPSGDRTAPVYPHGLGPSTLPLFVQSNLAVVTAAAIRLPARPEALRVVRLSFPPAVLAEATDAVRRLVAQGLTRGVPRIFDAAAGRAYGGAEGEYLVHLPVDGTAESVEALTKILTAEAHRAQVFTAVCDSDATDAAAAHHEVARLVERGYAGDPDLADTVFRTKMGVSADKVDSEAGFAFFLPLIPFSGKAVAKASGLLKDVVDATGVRLSATLHLLSGDLIDCVVAMKFPRHGEAAARAHRALDLLHRSFAEAGFPPYRLDIDHADRRDATACDPGAVALTRRLKAVLDPNGALAPGRYR